MPKAKNPYVDWTQDKIDTLVKLYLEGMTFQDISDQIGISYASTKAKLTALRQKGMDLPYRDTKLLAKRRVETIAKGGRKPSDFDIEYQGPVPFGHWLITKAWPYKPDKEEEEA